MGKTEPYKTTDEETLRINMRFDTFTEFNSFLTRDISKGGVFIISKKLKEPGAKVHLALTPPGSIGELEIEGRVVRVQSEEMAEKSGGHPGMGVHFTNVNDNLMNNLESLITKLAIAQKELMASLKTAPTLPEGEKPPGDAAPEGNRTAAPALPAAEEATPPKAADDEGWDAQVEPAAGMEPFPAEPSIAAEPIRAKSPASAEPALEEPADDEKLSGRDRRKHPRVPNTAAFSFSFTEPGIFRNFIATNIYKGEMFIRTMTPAFVGQSVRVNVNIELPLVDAKICFPAEVIEAHTEALAKSNNQEPGVQVRFLEMDEDLKRSINSILRNLDERAIQVAESPVDFMADSEIPDEEIRAPAPVLPQEPAARSEEDISFLSAEQTEATVTEAGEPPPPSRPQGEREEIDDLLDKTLNDKLRKLNESLQQGYYQVFELLPGASSGELDHAFSRLQKEIDPAYFLGKVSNDTLEEARSLLRKLDKARNVLGNRLCRAIYDALHPPGAAQADAGKGAHKRPGPTRLNVDLRQLSDQQNIKLFLGQAQEAI